MPYEAQVVQLARCAMGHHGRLIEVVFLSRNKDCLLVFSDGTVIAPDNDQSLEREYGTYRGYGEIAQQLGGTHPYSLLAFGYQGTGSQCFATFLHTAGFRSVSLSDIENMEPPVRLSADGSRVAGKRRDDSVAWDNQSHTPSASLGTSGQPVVSGPKPPGGGCASVVVTVAVVVVALLLGAAACVQWW